VVAQGGHGACVVRVVGSGRRRGGLLDLRRHRRAEGAGASEDGLVGDPGEEGLCGWGWWRRVSEGGGWRVQGARCSRVACPGRLGRRARARARAHVSALFCGAPSDMPGHSHELQCPFAVMRCSKRPSRPAELASQAHAQAATALCEQACAGGPLGLADRHSGVTACARPTPPRRAPLAPSIRAPGAEPQPPPAWRAWTGWRRRR